MDLHPATMTGINCTWLAQIVINTFFFSSVANCRKICCSLHLQFKACRESYMCVDFKSATLVKRFVLVACLVIVRAYLERGTCRHLAEYASSRRIAYVNPCWSFQVFVPWTIKWYSLYQEDLVTLQCLGYKQCALGHQPLGALSSRVCNARLSQHFACTYLWN